jgi:hypothetical protein
MNPLKYLQLVNQTPLQIAAFQALDMADNTRTKSKTDFEKNRHHSLLFIFFMRCNLIKLRTGGPDFLCGKFTLCEKQEE